MVFLIGILPYQPTLLLNNTEIIASYKLYKIILEHVKQHLHKLNILAINLTL